MSVFASMYRNTGSCFAMRAEYFIASFSFHWSRARPSPDGSCRGRETPAMEMDPVDQHDDLRCYFPLDGARDEGDPAYVPHPVRAIEGIH